MPRTAPSGALACLLAAIAPLSAGCGHAAERAPAWPRPAASETDGGESLAPRQPGVIAAIEDGGTATPAPPAGAAANDSADAAPADATPKADRPADAPAAREPDILSTEDIVIEIDD